MKEKPGSPTAEITFLYIEHGPENTRDVLAKIANFDVILLEATGIDLASLHYHENRINNTAREKNVIKKSFGTWPYLIAQNDDLEKGIILHTIHNKKEFRYIDSLAGTPEDQLRKLVSAQRWRWVKLFLNGKPSEALSVFKNTLNVNAVANLAREKIVVSQIEEMTKKFAEDWAGKKIVVLEGLVHTFTFRMYKKTHPEEKVSIGFIYPRCFLLPSTRIVKHLALFPDQQIDKKEYIRALIHEIMIFPRMIPQPPEKLNYLRALVLSKMTDKDVEDNWAKILKAESSFAANNNSSAYQKELVKISDQICESSSK